MDASIQLALMSKAKLVFENDADSFLSFPALAPLSYTPDQLKFVPVTSTVSMQVYSEFSLLTNSLPGGVLFQPSLDTFLWDEYLRVLRTADLAQGVLGAQRQADYQAAQAYLNTVNPDGTTSPSAAVVAYYQYQQAYLTAVHAYTAAELTASASTDPAVRAQWQNIDKPALQAQLQSAESDWESKGFKGKVEQEQQVVQACVALSPSLQWQSWNADCNPDIDFLTDGNNQVFGPTIYSPYDVLDQANWPTFTLAGPEIQKLVTAAPAELTNALDPPAVAQNIDSLSFEFSSVQVSRPWFHRDVFDARFWKFDSTDLLSDGNTPPAGEWPAYITGAVLARNIVLTTHSSGGPVRQRIPSFPPVRWHRPIVIPPPPKPKLLPQLTAEHLVPTISVQTAPNVATVATRTILARPQITLHPTVIERLNATTFASATTGSGTLPTTTTTSQSADDGRVSILAFICRRLGKCPNPDPALNWGAAPA